MQHDNGGRVIRRGADHAVFEIGGADAEEAGGSEGLHDHDVGFPKLIQMSQSSCWSSRRTPGPITTVASGEERHRLPRSISNGTEYGSRRSPGRLVEATIAFSSTPRHSGQFARRTDPESRDDCSTLEIPGSRLRAPRNDEALFAIIPQFESLNLSGGGFRQAI